MPPVAVDAAHTFTLVDVHGALFPGGQPDPVPAPTTPVPAGARVVGAAVASVPTGGQWLATADGRVIGVGVASLGEHRVAAGSPPIVGIAAAPSEGYWLAHADGHVYAFGNTAPSGT